MFVLYKNCFKTKSYSSSIVYIYGDNLMYKRLINSNSIVPYIDKKNNIDLGLSKELFLTDEGGHNEDFSLVTHVLINSNFDKNLDLESPIIKSINTSFKMNDKMVRLNQPVIHPIRPDNLINSYGDFDIIDKFNNDINTYDVRLNYLNKIKLSYVNRECNGIIDANNIILSELIKFSSKLKDDSISLIDMIRVCYNDKTLIFSNFSRIINFISIQSMTIYNGYNISCGEMIASLLNRYHTDCIYTQPNLIWYDRLLINVMPYFIDFKSKILCNIPDLSVSHKLLLYAPISVILSAYAIHNRSILKSMMIGGIKFSTLMIMDNKEQVVNSINQIVVWTPNHHDLVISNVSSFLSKMFYS